MLKKVFPRAHERYLSLPVLGSILEGFVGWLLEQRYTRESVKVLIRKARQLDRALVRKRVRKLADVTRGALLACAFEHGRNDRALSGVVRALERYFDEQRLLSPPLAVKQSRTEQQVALYRDYLEHERGIVPATIAAHLRTAREFLEHIGYEEDCSGLSDLTGSEIEAFVAVLAGRLSRETTQHAVAQIRSFLLLTLTLFGTGIPTLFGM